MGEGRIKQHITMLTIVVAFVAGLMATWKFYISTRPCRLEIPRGGVVSYRLDIERVPVDAQGRVLGDGASSSCEILLWGIGADGEVAMVAPDERGVDELTRLLVAPDGSVQRVDAAGRPMDAGRAVGLFDFNLLPLPAGSEQRWSAHPVYAVLPNGQRQVQAKVQRTYSGSDPRFRLEMPNISWINRHDRYDQIQDLSTEYRFNRSLGVIDQARLRCVFGRETADGERRYRITMRLQLQEMRQEEAPEQQLAMRDLALAIDAAQAHLERGAHQPLERHLERIRDSASDDPQLRALAQSVLQRAGSDHRSTAWALRFGTTTERHRDRARAEVARLRREGYPAYLETLDDGRIGLFIGPLPERDPVIEEAMLRRYARAAPYWQEVRAR